ncbi:hypothetical protein PMAYCL1PPCAC_32417, partial [Pristionchus mayeri]
PCRTSSTTLLLLLLLLRPVMSILKLRFQEEEHRRLLHRMRQHFVENFAEVVIVHPLTRDACDIVYYTLEANIRYSKNRHPLLGFRT